MAKEIRLAIAGVGNGACALLQGLAYYGRHQEAEAPGLMHPDLGGYRVTDIRVVAAFDVDRRKVGRDLAEAIFAPPNCAYRLPEVNVEATGVTVQMGPVLDGAPEPLRRFVEVAEREPVEVATALREAGAQVLLNGLPTGAAEAARHYAAAALEAGVGFVNGMPELIVCDPEFQRAAEKRGVPLVGDDVKSQLGGTIIHRALVEACLARGIRLRRTYQLNFAGNTDFYNLVRRGEAKELTKKEAVTGLLPYEAEVSAGFSYIALMGDRKTARFYLEGENFSGAPLRFEATLEVEDSANFAGVAVDAVRCCKIALDRGVGGVLEAASAFLMKHPPTPMSDDEARLAMEEFAAGRRER